MTIEKKINKIEDLNNILINYTSIQNNKNLKQTYLKTKWVTLGAMRDQIWNVDEIGEKRAIYRKKKLGQKGCWNLILPLENKIGRLIEIWAKSNHWIIT